MKYILAVDLGTTAVKVMLFDISGHILGDSTHEYQLITPDELSVELDVETYWNAFKEGVEEILKQSSIDPKEIESIGISAQGETLILVDKNGYPLDRAMVWLDNRAQEESKELTEVFGNEDTYKITGQVKIVPTWPAPKLLWYRKNKPDIFNRTAKFLLIEDYFIHRLAGKYLCEGSLICSTVYWDITKKIWWKEMLDYLNIKDSQLPEIRESGEIVGTLLPSVAEELGLSPDTIVTTGALDQACGAIGVGNIVPGVVSETTGAGFDIHATISEATFDKEMRMPCHYHGMPDTYMLHTFTTGGIVLKWFREQFCTPEMYVADLLGVDSYSLLDKEAESVSPGCNGLVMLPHLQGAMAPEANPKAKGVFYGFTLHHSKPSFIRSIMEAIAFMLQRNLDVLKDLGVDVKEIRSLGGGARSHLWNQIKADVTQIPLCSMKNPEAGCIGAAILAGKATGTYRSIEEAVKIMVDIKERVYPIKENAEIYSKAYSRYVDLYNSLLKMFEKE